MAEPERASSPVPGMAPTAAPPLPPPASPAVPTEDPDIHLLGEETGAPPPAKGGEEKKKGTKGKKRSRAVVFELQQTTGIHVVKEELKKSRRYVQPPFTAAVTAAEPKPRAPTPTPDAPALAAEAPAPAAEAPIEGG